MDNDYTSVPRSAGTANKMPTEASGAQLSRPPMLMLVLEEQVRIISQVESLAEGLANRLQPILRNEVQEKAINGENKETTQPPFIQALVENNNRLIRQVRELKGLVNRLEL